jgi:hypothetical protein
LSHLSRQLILEDYGQLRPRGIKEYLMHHVVGAPAVFDHAVEGDGKENYHEGQHDWVALVEGVFFYPVV